MKAIITRYLGPTNRLGSRIKATAGKNTIILPWDYSLEDNITENHRKAAHALREKMGWVGPHYGLMHTGGLESGDMVHVMTWAESEYKAIPSDNNY